MARFEDFTKMNVWQLVSKLLIKIYSITKEFPSEEKFGMTSDMRRAANSIMHNIAEGFGRYEEKDKTRFYKISRGSGYELNSQLIASFHLKFLENKTVLDKTVEECKTIIKELDSLIKTIEAKIKR